MTVGRRLLVFTENYLRGGGTRYCVDLVNALAAGCDEVVLASNEGALSAEDRSRLAPQVRVVRAPFVTRSRARHALRRVPRLIRAGPLGLMSLADPVLFRVNVALLSRLLRRVGPDAVVSCNGGYPAARATLAMVVAARRCGVPAALSVVSMPEPRRGLRAAYDRVVDAAVWRSVRLVIVNARAIAGALGALRDMPPHLARTAYGGLPDAPVAPAADSRPTIGFVARLDRAKGVFVLLEAFRQLASRWPELRLRVVGEGDASNALRDRARAIGLDHRVDADGHLAGDVHSLLGSFRVYAFPSFHEGLPYSILEAMRAGCPIVSTAVGGIPEVLENGRDALLVPPGDAGALAEAIDSLLRDDARSRQLGRAARRRFEDHHLLERVALEVRAAFHEAGLL